MVLRRLLQITVATMTLVGIGVVAGTGSPAAATGTLSARRPCTGAAPPHWRHVVVVLMENHSYRQVIGHSRYVDSLAHVCGLATNYHGITYPSLPNYLALTGGSTFGVRDDKSPAAHRIYRASIFSQVDSRSLQEGMPSNCASSGGYRYAVKHNPHAYYVRIHRQCLQRDVPLGASPNLSAGYTFITPDLCHDTHDCLLRIGDMFLRGFIPKLLDTAQYQAGNTAIFLTWDTDNRHEGNHVATVVIAPSVRPGTRAGIAYTHYSLLRSTEQMLGVPALANAASARSMRAGMHL